MQRNRLEAFSDGVLAIVITIMVLELKVPHEPTWEALKPLWGVSLAYLLSFVHVAIYWNNHHHMLHTVQVVNGKILWANMHLLFWLSLVPFVAGWLGENKFQAIPTAAYGFVLAMAACAYFILQRTIIRGNGSESLLKVAVGRDWKGKVSLTVYLLAIGVSFWQPVVANALYWIVAAFWVMPDRRIERHLVPQAVPHGPVASRF